jgi:hypothetical protein
MITYLYWIGIITIAFGLFYYIGYKLEAWKISAIVCFSVLLIGLIAYHFHFQQIFVKRYGGVMSIKVPEGELHITTTWKDDNLWVENYNPKTNTCHFREYSRGAVLQGQVTIKNCNPIQRQTTEPGVTPQ